jgi:hypothetical protein
VSMFSMFVESPPASTPVNLVYFEKRPFGPFGKAAGEVSTETGFSEILWLQVAQSAPGPFRMLRVICDGTLRVLGPQQGFPANDTTAPYTVELVPAPLVMRELQRLCAAQNTETPRRIIYHGVDLASLTSLLSTYFSSQVALRLYDALTDKFIQPDRAALIAQFVSGQLSVPVIKSGLGPGRALGIVSAKNLKAGWYTFGIEIQTSPPIAASLTPRRTTWTR